MIYCLVLFSLCFLLVLSGKIGSGSDENFGGCIVYCGSNGHSSGGHCRSVLYWSATAPYSMAFDFSHSNLKVGSNSSNFGGSGDRFIADSS